MKAFCISLLLSCAAAGAARQTAFKPASSYQWKIAQRLDSGRVVIMLTDEDAIIPTAEHEALAPVMPKPAPEFLAVFLEGVRPLPVEMGRRLTKNATAPGDRWAIDAGRAGWFETSVDGFVLAGGGCSEFAAAMASIEPAKLAAFSKVREKYFPARLVSGWAPPAAATAVGPMAYVVTPNDRQNIEALLRRAFEQESPKILQKMAADKNAIGVDEMRERYRRIAAGGGRINFDVQPFRLTPDGLPRLFVRAIWNVDGKSAFLMTAWVRTAPVFQIESADFHAAEQQFWLSFKLDGPAELSSLGEVLSIADVDRDGLAEIVMLYQYYEGISIEVSKYPPAEPGGAEVIARFGAGC